MALAAPVAASEHRQSNLLCHAGTYRFDGSVEKGMSYSHRFDGLTFGLEPIEHGWSIDISQGSRRYLANMTGPSQGPGNPLYIEGWHFRNAANSGPNTGDVDEPQERRTFLFSPRWNLCENATRLDKDGRGVLDISDLELSPLGPGQKANIQRMQFKVTLTISPSACTPCRSHGR
jgi:hypothetical protein